MDVKGNLIEITQFQQQVAISILFEKRRPSSRRQSQLCYCPNLLPPQRLGKSLCVNIKLRLQILAKEFGRA